MWAAISAVFHHSRLVSVLFSCVLLHAILLLLLLPPLPTQLLIVLRSGHVDSFSSVLIVNARIAAGNASLTPLTWLSHGLEVASWVMGETGRVGLTR